MGLFSKPKCPIHKKAYKVGKDHLCQPYYYCLDCARDAKDKKEVELKIENLEERLEKIENFLIID